MFKYKFKNVLKFTVFSMFRCKNCNFFSFNGIIFLSFIDCFYTLSFFSFFSLFRFFLLLWNSCLIISCGVYIEYISEQQKQAWKYCIVAIPLYTFSLIDLMLFFSSSYVFCVCVFSPFLISLSLLILSKQYPLFHNIETSFTPVAFSPLVCPFAFHQICLYMFIFCQI